MKRSLYNVAVARQTVVPAGRTASVTGATVDRQVSGSGAFRSAMLVVATGVITDSTHTVELQESLDGTTWTAVADEFLQGAEPAIGAADDNKVFEVGYTGSARYLRAVVTLTNVPATAPVGGILGAVILLAWPGTMPPSRV